MVPGRLEEDEATGFPQVGVVPRQKTAKSYVNFKLLQIDWLLRIAACALRVILGSEAIIAVRIQKYTKIRLWVYKYTKIRSSLPFNKNCRFVDLKALAPPSLELSLDPEGKAPEGQRHLLRCLTRQSGVPPTVDIPY